MKYFIFKLSISCKHLQAFKISSLYIFSATEQNNTFLSDKHMPNPFNHNVLPSSLTRRIFYWVWHKNIINAKFANQAYQKYMEIEVLSQAITNPYESNKIFSFKQVAIRM